MEMVNQVIAGELYAILHHMWHHIMVKGINVSFLLKVFERVSVQEMKHVEKIAKRLFYFDVPLLRAITIPRA